MLDGHGKTAKEILYAGDQCSIPASASTFVSRCWPSIIAFLAALTLGSVVWTLWPAAPETAGGWLKVDANPVLGGSLGTVFDMSVLQENGRFRMWFSWRPKASIALVESPDGTHWTAPTIVLGPNAATSWERKVNRPIVVHQLNVYNMWYTGQAGAQSYIGHATSPDGIAWTRTSTRPVISPDQLWEKSAVMVPHVLWDADDRIYKMWYSGGEQYEPDAIGYAVSADGRTWSKRAEPVFTPSPKYEWDSFKVTGAQVVRSGDWYVMYYIGFRDPYHAQIGLARSRSGISAWQRHSANPIIRPGQAGRWDADAVYKPFAILSGTQWYLWFNGRRGKIEQIGLALHADPDLGFDRDDRSLQHAGPLTGSQSEGNAGD